MTEGDAFGTPCSINGSLWLHYNVFTAVLTFLYAGWGFCIKIDNNAFNDVLKRFYNEN